ncbi:eukaryotic translation initiation factor 4E [Ceraceosorus guamensis]|uniref:Eukaryotic translation initiation factor 4E n=1 Tax=Ceraceosorus guamensis TaxID=1522189 RepID=A0A316W7F0_9BASI|nr:eukaryotic translation initiation factor 4E [Ceraceosorus guamensis]PWN43575.1 eukaryotic translation initiation factor 4E [Ceraceosorus guamensis]
MDSASVSNNNGAEGQTKGGAGADLDVRTVFNDPDNFNVKHPLFNNWTLWFDNPSAKGMTSAKGGKDSWGEDLNKVVTFDSVEEFWGLYNNIIPPSDLPQKANYYLFKDGIKPAWEDPANADGGKWAIQLPRDRSRGNIDKLWLHTMLAAIGETLEAPYDGSAPAVGVKEVITGVILSARPNFYRIAIWTREAGDATADELDQRLLDIGKHLKTNIMGWKLGQNVASGLQSDVEFQSHKESEKKKGKKFTV